MKKNLLLELLLMINGNNALSEKIANAFKTDETKGYEELLKLTDEQIKNILKQETTDLQFFKTYMYLKDNMIPENIKQLVNSKLEESPENLERIMPMLESSSLLSRRDAYSFFEIIFQSHGLIADCVAEASTDEDLLSKEDALEFVKVISDAKDGRQVVYAATCASDTQLLTHKDALEIVKIVANAQDEEHAEYAYCAAIDYELLKREDTIEFVRLFANAENPSFLETATVLFSSHICKREDAIEFFKVILNAKGEKQADEAAKLALDPNVRDRVNALEIVQLIANAINENNIRYGTSAARNVCGIPTINVLEVVKLVLEAKGHNQSRAASILASIDALILKSDALDFIKLVANSNNERNAIHVAFALKNQKLLEVKDLFSVAQIIMNTKNASASEYVRKVAVNEVLQQSPIFLSILQTIASASEEYQAKIASDIACNPNINISTRPDALQIINAFVTSKGELQSKYAKCLIEEYPTLVSLNGITAITTCKDTKKISGGISIKEKLFSPKSILSFRKDSSASSEPFNLGIKEVLSQGNVDIAIQLLRQTNMPEIDEKTIIKVKTYK